MCALVPNCSIRSAGGGRRDDSSARGTLITTPPTPDGTVSRFLVYVAGARARHSQPRRRRGATSLSCRESTRLRGRPKVPPPSLPACPPLPSARSHGTRDTDTHGTVWRRRRRQIWGYYTVSTYCRLRTLPRTMCVQTYICTATQQSKAQNTVLSTHTCVSHDPECRKRGNVPCQAPGKAAWLLQNLVARRARLEIRAPPLAIKVCLPLSRQPPSLKPRPMAGHGRHWGESQ